MNPSSFGAQQTLSSGLKNITSCEPLTENVLKSLKTTKRGMVRIDYESNYSSFKVNMTSCKTLTETELSKI